MTQHKEIAQLMQRLQTFRQAVADMEELLDRYANAQQLLQHSEEQFRLLVTGVREYAIFMLDAQGHIVSWNTGAELIKGYRAEEIIGRHFSIFYPPEDVASHKPKRALQIATTQGAYKEEGWRIRKDGSSFWASVVITALYDEDGTLRGFGKVTRDQTERKLAEEAQQQLREQELRIAREQAAREQAEADAQLRDDLLRSTAHDLRTPLTSLLGYAQLLRRRFDRGEVDAAHLQKPVHVIAAQAQRLDRLTTMLLDITRLEQSAWIFEPAPIDLRHGIEQVVQELRLLIDRHSIVTRLPAAPLVVEGDELRFEQVMYNLIQNAIKYSPIGGVITVTASQEAQQAVITVTDEGMGIPTQDLPNVFERFYRATNVPHATISGLGLGLYLVKEYVGMLKGAVEVQSSVGEGTTFRVTIPLSATGATPPRNAEHD